MARCKRSISWTVFHLGQLSCEHDGSSRLTVPGAIVFLNGLLSTNAFCAAFLSNMEELSWLRGTVL